MNRIVTLFRKHSRRFSGKISIAAHSLGGVICFDLLANQESVRLHVLSSRRKKGERGWKWEVCIRASLQHSLRVAWDSASTASDHETILNLVETKVVELAEVRVREKARQDPRRQHLKYVTTSYPKLQFNVVNLFGYVCRCPSPF